MGTFANRMNEVYLNSQQSQVKSEVQSIACYQFTNKKIAYNPKISFFVYNGKFIRAETVMGRAALYKNNISIHDGTMQANQIIAGVAGLESLQDIVFNFGTPVHLSNLVQIATHIEETVTVGDEASYRNNAFQSPRWCRMYQKQTNVAFPSINGTVVGTTAEDGYPCYKCGILFPKKNITIDHQKPQAGGETKAVLKVFRAFGLTKVGPTGAKGLFFNGAKYVDNANINAIYNPNPVPIDLAKVKGMSDEDKYSLNNVGEFMLSCAGMSGMNPNIMTVCMNSIINLKPLCGSCNSKKSNKQ